MQPLWKENQVYDRLLFTICLLFFLILSSPDLQDQCFLEVKFICSGASL